MKLYWGKHTCAIGIHILLEEAGAAFETEEIDVAGDATKREPFKTINPKEKVPFLVRDDGSSLTEYGAMATWIGMTWPEAGLIPEAVENRVRMIEIMDYAVGTLHALAFHRFFRASEFEPKDLLHKTGLGLSSIKAEGVEMVRQGFATIDRELEGRTWVGGPRFSVGDTALFYCERWAPDLGVALPPNVAAHFDRMKVRPSVRRALEFYGEA